MLSLNAKEQAKLNATPFVNVVDNKKILTVSKLYDILKNKSEGNRFTFLNFTVSPESGKVNLKKTGYARNIYNNADNELKKLIAIAIKDNMIDGKLLYKMKDGMYVTLLVNTGDETKWSIMNSLLINVSTTDFSVSKVYGNNEGPDKATVKIFNNTDETENYEKYLVNKELDNEKLCEITNMLQKDVKYCLDVINKTENAGLYESKFNEKMLESNCLDYDNRNSLYRNFTIKVVGNEFKNISNEDPKLDFCTLRFKITKIKDNNEVGKYNSYYKDGKDGKCGNFDVKDKFVICRNHKVMLRHVNTKLVGNTEKTNMYGLLDSSVSLTTYRCSEYKGKYNSIYAYRSSDPEYKGIKNTIFSEFDSYKNQVINAIVDFKMYISKDNISINMDLSHIGNIYIIRTDHYKSKIIKVDNNNSVFNNNDANDDEINLDDYEYNENNNSEKESVLLQITNDAESDVDEDIF